MHRLLVVAVSAVALAGLVTPGHADEPANQNGPKTYTVSCKLVRKVPFDTPAGRRELETIEHKVPDLTALEGTRAAYHSGGKVGASPYGFHMRVKVTGAAKGGVRLEARVKDSTADGAGPNPIVRTHRQRVIRHVTLGKPIKLELEAGKEGEGVWVELTVREAAEG